ncbi:MAG: YafY family protein [Siphonobacter sp.]
MPQSDTSRLSRLIAILTSLQTKRIITATSLSNTFKVSIRTIYRDIKTLEQAGVPIMVEEGKGYSLMEGYRLPPVMFSETEANALITAEQLVLKNTDSSFIHNYHSAITKVKAVVKNTTKDQIDFLSKRIAITPHIEQKNVKSNLMSSLQTALLEFKLAKIEYRSGSKNEQTSRIIEPFAFYNDSNSNWILIAFCRLRRDYRSFRLDRIEKLSILTETFQPHDLTLEEFIEKQKKNEYP